MDAAVLACAPLQRVGTSFHLAKDFDADRAVVDLLARWRRVAKVGGTIPDEVGIGKRSELTGANFGKVPKALGCDPRDPRW